MSSGVLLFLFAALASFAPASSSLSRLPPIDQCETAPGFSVFRNQLKDIIERRDPAELMATLSDDVTATFGQGGDGKQEFAATWRLDKSLPSRVWDELGKALALGCAESGDALVSPSIIAQFDPMRDAFETMWAVVPGSALRAEPNDHATVVAQLDWDLLTVTDVPAPDPWQGVKLDDGRIGFVRRDQVRSIIDYRAVFERRDGHWQMTAFVAGD